jgi:CRP-like cAMP-binding protein
MWLSPICSSLTQADRALLNTRTRVLTLKRDEVLVNAGQMCDAMFYVVTGKLRVETPSDSHTASLTGFLQPKELYIESVAQTEYWTSNTLRAALPCMVQSLPLDVIQNVILRNPDVGFKILQQGMNHSSKLRRQLRRLKMEPVSRQVARAAYDIADTRPDGSRVLGREITQADIAQFIGVSREAVNKEFKQLSEAELLKKSTQGIELHANLASTDFMGFSDFPAASY